MLEAWLFGLWMMVEKAAKVPFSVLILFFYKIILFLQTIFKNKFGLQVTIQRHGNGHRLYFPKSQLQQLSKIVKPFMLPCMYYKLNLNDH